MANERTKLNEAARAVSLEIEIFERIDQRVETGVALALPEKTIVDTIARYDGASLSTAVALELTQALVPELSLDGTLDEDDISIIDRMVEVLEANSLVGISYEDLSRVLGVNLEHGSLLGISTMAENLTNADTSQELLEALHAEFGYSNIAEQADVDEYRRDAGIDVLSEEDDLFDETDNVDDTDLEDDEEAVTSDDGEEFDF